MKFRKIIALVIVCVCIFIANEKNEEQEINNFATNTVLLKNIKNETNFVLEDSKLILPCIGVLTSKFGYRESSNAIVSKNHKGIDIGANNGSKIVAAHDGVVLKAGVFGNYGKCVVLQNSEYVTLYAHCSKIIVEEGMVVSKGEKIAEVGMTRKCYR